MDTEKAKKTIEEILNLIGIPAEEISYSFDEKKGHVFSVKSVGLDKISQERGEDITRDLVYLLKRLFSKSTTADEEGLKCTIDVNDHQSKTDEKIKLKALNSAEEARNLKTDVVMDPMSSYERMIVHSTLSGLTDISTESTGEGRDRRVKVKYLAI